MNDQQKLPPLPPSDQESLSRNAYDPFWHVGAREFWGDNKISRNEIQPFNKCEHYFISKDQGAECQNCHIGYQGPFYKISEGKIFLKESTPTEE